MTITFPMLREKSDMPQELTTRDASIKNDVDQNIKCSAYFIEPLQWIIDAHQGELDGKILCPKCNSKLGNYNWAGMQCSCGAWITPSFSIHRERVDEVITRSITPPT
ncbi:1645_t:CDS:2 [Ambispora gerdemannii]|uniref:protein-tyrosine-phosphatase n=1 Tax=Ambispora gerdemannii TaxID=144530 RepID=A0A9N8VQ12_9GLOM|nr:1645_t:CDS:2 [Ambispora gerdemannii]